MHLHTPSLIEMIGLTTLMTLTACGSEDTGTPAAPADYTAATGVEGSAQIKDLSAEQKQALCEAGRAHAISQFGEDEVEKFACTFAGLFAAALTGSPTVEVCESAFDECMASNDVEPEGSEDCGLLDVTNDCTVTVEALEACADDMVALTKSTMAKFSRGCSIAADKDEFSALLSEAQGQTRPESCTTLETACPGILGSDD